MNRGIRPTRGTAGDALPRTTERLAIAEQAYEQAYRAEAIQRTVEQILALDRAEGRLVARISVMGS
jgi:hypothetical protein